MKFCFTKVALCLVILIFCPKQVNGDEPIKIGVILPLTGDMAAVGAACRDAIRMAEQDRKSATPRFKFIFEDDKLAPLEAAKAAQKLLKVDKVSAIISTWSYGGTIVSPLAERAKVPHIGVAWDHHVADGEYNFLHLTPPSEFMRKFLEAFKKLGVTRVALLGVEESGSVFALDEFVRIAPEYGVKVVYRDAVLWDLKDFNSLVTKITQARPEYLLVNLGGDILNSALQNALQMQKVSFRKTAITSYDVASDLRPLEGRWYVSDSLLPEDFAKNFEERFGHSIRYGVGNFYEAARLLMYGFDMAPLHDSVGAKDELQKIHNMPSLFGATSVDSKGIFSYPARYVRIEAGRRAPITFADIAQ